MMSTDLYKNAASPTLDTPQKQMKKRRRRTEIFINCKANQNNGLGFRWNYRIREGFRLLRWLFCRWPTRRQTLEDKAELL